MNMNRRKLLKASGASLASSSVPLAAIGNAEAVQSSDKYVGQSYHTLSHEAQGRVDANLYRDAKNRLHGQIDVGGYTISSDQINGLTPQPALGDSTVYSGKSSKEQHTESGKPLAFKLVDHGKFMVGHITRPDPEYARVGITINHESSKISAEDIKKGLRSGGKPREGYEHVEMPKTGIPKAVIPEEQ